MSVMNSRRLMAPPPPWGSRPRPDDDNTIDKVVRRTARLFDDLIGCPDQGRRQFEAKRLGGLEINHELEFGWLLYRQVGWFLAFENAIDVRGSTPVGVDTVDAVGHEAAVRSE